MRNWRAMTWVLYSWVALTIFFVIFFNVYNANPDDCLGQGDAYQAGCELGQDIAPALLAVIALTIGFCGFIVLSLIWFMTKPKPQPQVVYVQPGRPLPPPNTPRIG